MTLWGGGEEGGWGGRQLYFPGSERPVLYLHTTAIIEFTLLCIFKWIRIRIVKI